MEFLNLFKNMKVGDIWPTTRNLVRIISTTFLPHALAVSRKYLKSQRLVIGV